MNNFGQYGPFKQPSQVELELSKRVAALRMQKGYTQAELVRRSGVSLGSLRCFEQTGKISLTNLLLISHLLGRITDFDDLLAPIDDTEEFKEVLSERTRRYYNSSFS
jgi:transcriptional regulator with XRE-family HTH domain